MDRSTDRSGAAGAPARRHGARRWWCATAVVSMLFTAAPADARERDRDARCDRCGTVVTTNRKDERGNGTAGTVVGGVGGAVAGNVIGHDTTSTVLGGVGGAVAGNLIGKKMGSRKIWSVQVKMDDGDVRDVDYDRDPGFRQGERVRIVDGRLSRR